MSLPVQVTIWRCIECGADDQGRCRNIEQQHCRHCWIDGAEDVAQLWCFDCERHTEFQPHDDWA